MLRHSSKVPWFLFSDHINKSPRGEFGAQAGELILRMLGDTKGFEEEGPLTCSWRNGGLQPPYLQQVVCSPEGAGSACQPSRGPWGRRTVQLRQVQ